MHVEQMASRAIDKLINTLSLVNKIEKEQDRERTFFHCINRQIKNEKNMCVHGDDDNVMPEP